MSKTCYFYGVSKNVDATFHCSTCLLVELKGFSHLGLRIVGTDELGCMSPLEIAAAKGYDEIVDILLLDPRVNPAYNNNEALYLAARNNHLHIVKKLLQNNDVLTKGSLTHALGVTYSDGIIKLLRKAKTNRKKIRWERRLNLVKNAFRIH